MMLHLRDIPNDEILACPDPTGRQQQTSSALGLSERTILARRGFKARAPKTPWSIRDKGRRNPLADQSRQRSSAAQGGAQQQSRHPQPEQSEIQDRLQHSRSKERPFPQGRRR